ncbi:MAG: RnfH family protein [Burkholderiaceae bacterium]|nr:RnfH family protein [Burkholderiaceae bacterium]
MADSMAVQVCYAKHDGAILRQVFVPAGATVEQAIRQSGILQQVPEIDLAHNRTGIFGKLKPLDAVVREHDRIEIYRPLIADPKEARRRRAERG